MSKLAMVLGEEEEDPFVEYDVVRSIHGDYSIWPTIKDLPAGWERVEVRGPKAECLDWIEHNWSGPSLR
jgi:MbtH protein